MDTVASSDDVVMRCRAALQLHESGRVVIAIDGRSGSGKTTLAQRLVQDLEDVRTLNLDQVYPDWDGLAAGARKARDIVRSWRQTGHARFTPTRWPGMAAQEPQDITGARALIVEGVGAIWASHAEVSVWVEQEVAVRKRRALARDGDTYAPHWERWAAQEEEWFATHPIDDAHSRHLVRVRLEELDHARTIRHDGRS